MPGSRIKNWAEVRTAYIEGSLPDPQRDAFARSWPTLEEVSLVYGIAPAHLRNRAAREEWTTQREQFQEEVEQARRRHLSERKVEQTTRIDDRGLSNAEAGLGLVGMRLTYLLNQQTNVAQNLRGQGVDARELTALGLAAKRFLDVKAQIMGQPLTATESIDEMERTARREEARLAEELVRFIAERAADAESDDLADAL